jgi:hypothetical protein
MTQANVAHTQNATTPTRAPTSESSLSLDRFISDRRSTWHMTRVTNVTAAPHPMRGNKGIAERNIGRTKIVGSCSS